ncbi:hypothetical protein [Viridibacillus sp. FSL H8-0110]|uniref:hypothetical protein n=1 Tax=Viridibacillus sp. FSL H8-0110 TaxID=2921376 RepID=UPI0030F875BA
MIKKLILSTLSFALLFSLFNLEASAEDEVSGTSIENVDTNDTKSPKINIEEELKLVTDQTNSVEIIDAAELPEGTPTINFNSVEEFKNVVAAFEKYREESIDVDNIEDIMVPDLFASRVAKAAATTKNGASTIKWMVGSWNPIKNQIMPNEMVIDFTYTYTGSGSSRKFAKIKQIVSNSSGIAFSTWVESTKPIHNFYDSKKGVEIKIQGYFLVGVNIKGQAIGTKFNDSFTQKYHF